MGAGVNLFKTLFAEDYYPYTANVLKSSMPTSKVIKDSDNQTIQTITLSGVEMRGLIKVVDGKLVAYGDTDDGSGTGEVNYEIVDLGSLVYTRSSTDTTGKYRFQAVISDIKKGSGDKVIPNLICSDYLAVTPNNTYHCIDGICVRTNYQQVIIYDDSNSALDATAFKTAMSGKYLVYELATPTTQTLTAWNNPIKACEGGTEEFTDTRAIKLPTGHDTVYGTDLIAKTADFGTTVYGGSFDFTTGELISDKNADGTDKAPETISLTPMTVPARSGDNYIITDADGSNSVKYFDAI